ncbi:AAA family ATPase (macronuclear) [Tetrahymena thermophila SB210]|uniref:AAA family ATPase n=1 Tax=Tetrahymena thermophila (strain SB210) TaxID=312017 RepID=I7M939_TETTS|nr:AAA family ATPase [Tetrahymena thermophila SB210]EAS00653.2 AAA family ATPase [Tetrahymena thermophila SB210]|eukprot:XP_001020898.2 AAA family ATPase [Tetrahymena thermophila SB210]
MDVKRNKQFDNEDISSIQDYELNSTFTVIDNKSMIFISDQPYFRAKDQSEVSEEADFASGFLTNQNSSYQDSVQSSFISKLSNPNRQIKQIVPKIPLQQNQKNYQQTIYEADEVISLNTQTTISSLNDEQKDEMFLEGFKLKWDDLIGVDEQKKVIYQMIMMPLRLPNFFKKISPTNTLLIYGPQNCGKASIVKCLANQFKEIKVTYVKASLMLNKRNGEEFIDPKKVFREVKKYKKVLIYIEDIDDIFGFKHQVPDQEQDQIIQSQQCSQYILSSLQEIQKQKGVFIFASSRCPWKLSQKLQMFFQKFIKIKWPNKEQKFYLIKKQLKLLNITSLQDSQIKNISSRAKRYSCLEIIRMVEYLHQQATERAKYNIKIIQDNKEKGYSLFNSEQPQEDDFLEYIQKNKSELVEYDKQSFDSYEETVKEKYKTEFQKREEMLRI